MKKLTRIKLINWHLFSNVTIDITDNTLITGENATGKTTLLDAIQFLLVGGKGGSHFNIAANTDGKRTVENYIKGKTGDVGNEYIRTGDVVTHICIEYFDQYSKEYSIIGCVLELPRNGKLNDRFYFIESIKVSDDLFIEDKTPRNYLSMKAYFKNTLQREFKVFETTKAYREQVSKFFNIDANKYAKILPKALAFKPINLQTFVNDFLLDVDDVDINSIKNNFENLKKIEEKIQIDEDKLTILNKISESSIKCKDQEIQIQVNNLLTKINYIENQEDYLKNTKLEIDNLVVRSNNYNSKKTEHDNALVNKDNEILTLEKSKESNDFSKTINTLNSNIELKEQELQRTLNAHNELVVNIEEELMIYKDLNSVVKNNKHIDDFVDYLQKNSSRYSYNVNTLNTLLSNLANEKAGLEVKYRSGRDQLDSEKMLLAEEVRASRVRLQSLDRSEKVYPITVNNLIKVLNQGLSEHFKKNIYVTPLCELIEVTDEQWRNACEGQLGQNRFNIIVEPDYFEKALEIYEENKVQLGIYGVGLVNTGKLEPFNTWDEGSLASKISSEHKYARLYINMLLSKIIAVEKLSELKNYPRSITKTCMTYFNFTASQINPRSYQVPYIGAKSNEIQIQIENDAIKNAISKIDKIDKELSSMNYIINKLKVSNVERIVNDNRIRFIEILDNVQSDLKKLKLQKEELGSNLDYDRIENAINKLKGEKAYILKTRDEIISEIRSISDARNVLEQNIASAKTRVLSYTVERDKIAKENPEFLVLAKEQYEVLKKKHQSFALINTYLENNSKRLEESNARYTQDCHNNMNEYNFKYAFPAAPDISSIALYESEKVKIRDHNLVNYRLEAQDLSKKLEISFKEEFINKLRSSIDAAQNQIDDINTALQNKHFVDNSYKLIIGPSEEADFAQYYKIIMKEINDDELYTDTLSKKNEQMLDTLFRELVSSSLDDKKTQRFLDYRNYINCDIEITDIYKNSKIHFSKVATEKSGGETQSPYYIVIAAAFQTLLSKNKRVDSGCIVLFDEAFSNMDSGRIGAMMDFYNSLSIQIMIATPPNKAPDIHAQVNTKLIIMKHKDNAIIYPFYDIRELGKYGIDL